MDKLRCIKSSNIGDVLAGKLALRNIDMPGISPVLETARIVGPATTLTLVPARTMDAPIKLGEFVDRAPVGSVLVIDAAGDLSLAIWGGHLSARAKARGIEGMVIDGAVRDVDEIKAVGFPAFSRGRATTWKKGQLQAIAMDAPVVCGGALVESGDIIVGDSAGVVVIPRPRLGEAAALASELEESDREKFKKYRTPRH